MHKFFVSREAISNNKIVVNGDDVEHISKVLRLRPGDNILISDGEESEYVCAILSLDKKTVCCNIIDERSIMSEAPVKIDLYQGIPKAAKMDIIVQKCTELGVDTIIPVNTERVVVKIGDDRDFNNKLVRWKRIVQEASKQSNRGRIPTITGPVKYQDAMDNLNGYDLIVVPYEKEDSVGLKQALKGKNNIHSIAIFIGPEGGFSEEEIDKAVSRGAVPVTLGPRILRTETAGFACVSIIMYELGDMGGKPWQK